MITMMKNGHLQVIGLPGSRRKREELLEQLVRVVAKVEAGDALSKIAF